VFQEKKGNTPRPGRRSAEIVWGPAPQRSQLAWPLARPRRSSGIQRQFGPLLFRPNFELVKKKEQKKKKKKGDVHARHTYISIKKDKLLCPFRVAVALPCVSGVIYLYRDTFFFDFSTATACYHCVHIAYLLHDFDRFSYSLSTTSC
jgi:hypothetical protein